VSGPKVSLLEGLARYNRLVSSLKASGPELDVVLLPLLRLFMFMTSLLRSKCLLNTGESAVDGAA
jgi:hypothetical protein